MKKFSSTKSFSQLNNSSDKNLSKLLITAYTLSCATGTHPASLLSAMRTQTYAPNLNSELFSNQNKNLPAENQSLISNPNQKSLPPFYASPILHLGELNLPERIEVLLQSSLLELEIKLGSSLPRELLRFHFLLPEKSSVRYRHFDPQHIKQLIYRHGSSFESSTITFSHRDENSANLLLQLQTELQQGKWQGIILGSVDSLIDEATCQRLDEHQSLRIATQDYGVIPGESAAFVLLQTQPTFPVLATINAISSKSISPGEENFSMAMQQAFNTMDLSPSAVVAILLSHGKNANDPIEWYTAQQAIWPFNPDQASTTPEEWNTHSTLGDLGAAEIPTHLILACERMRYPFLPTKYTLVAETNSSANSVMILSK